MRLPAQVGMAKDLGWVQLLFLSPPSPPFAVTILCYILCTQYSHSHLLTRLFRHVYNRCIDVSPPLPPCTALPGYGTTDSGRKFLQQQFRTCSPIRAKGVYNGTFHDDAMDIVQWAAGIWGTIAMGNYPYASSYLLHGKSLLPPWPVTTACLPLEFELTDDKALMNAVRPLSHQHLFSAG